MSTSRSLVQQWADQQGFGPARRFDGVKTAVGGNPNARHSGFYLLIFDDDSYYVGESVNLRARMAQHGQFWGSEISDVQFIRQNLSKQQLRAVEKQLIYGLNGAIPDRCRNKTHASASFGTDALDEFLPEAEQHAWLDDPAAFNASDASSLKAMTPAQAVKYSTAAKRFAAHAGETDATTMLRTYLENCVPAPRRTEFQGWSVSTGTYGGARLLCVCVGKMETFVVGSDLSGFIVVRRSVLLDGAKNFKKLTKRHPGIRVKERSYHDAGADTITVFADSASSLISVLDDSLVLRAAARLVLDVMRKHPCVYTRYHCPQVVERVYPESSRGIVEPATLPEAELRRTATEDAAHEAITGLPDDPKSSADDELVDDAIELCWFVNAGPQKTKRNTLAEFVEKAEWRMDPTPKYAQHVQEMLPGERIAVRVRRNVVDDVPFDRRGHKVSVMDILLTGTITDNPGNGCSVRVEWNPVSAPRRWYLYTNQDRVWAIAVGAQIWSDELVDFAFSGGGQDLNFWRNQPYWHAKFGD